MTTLRQRVGPFLALLDARYLPLLFVAAPQAYTVYAWLIGSGAPPVVAGLGGIGFEFVYIGSIAWAERGAGWQAARGPALMALLFSVAVAVAYYGPAEGPLAALHAGFSVVGYFYMVLMHAAPAPAPQSEPQAQQHITQAVQVNVAQPAPLPQTVRQFIAQRAHDLRLPDGSMPSLTAVAAALGTSADTVRRALAEGSEEA